jgi:hypothetical protein
MSNEYPYCLSGVCSNVPGDIINVYPIFTSFRRELGPLEVQGFVDSPRQNYTPYDLYCLSSKLQPYIHKEYKGCEIFFVGYHIDNEVKLTIVLMRGGNAINISPEEGREIQRKVDKEEKKYPGYYLFFHYKDWYSGRDHINGVPLTWIHTVSQFMFFKDCDVIYDRGDIYLKSIVPDFTYQRDRLYDEFYTVLENMYKSSIIPICVTIYPSNKERITDNSDREINLFVDL